MVLIETLSGKLRVWNMNYLKIQNSYTGVKITVLT